MQRYQALALVALLFFSGCASAWKEKYYVGYDIVIVELDHTGKTAHRWNPVRGSVYTFFDEDAVFFTDSVTGLKHQIGGSYKFLKK